MKLLNSELRFFEHKLPRRAVGYLLALFYAFSVAWALTVSHGLEVTAGKVFVWCALVLLGLSICFYNKITTGLTFLALAFLLYYEFRWNGAWDWIKGDLLDTVKPIGQFLIGGERPDPEVHFLISLLFIVLASLFAYLSAGHLAGASTMTVAGLGLFITLWYLDHRDIFLNMAICAAVIAAVSVISFGRKRASTEAKALDRDYDEADAPPLRRSLRRREYEPHVISGGGASAIAVTGSLYVLLAVLLILIFPPGEKNAKAFQNRTVVAAVDDVVDYVGQYVGFERPRSAFNLAAAGWGEVGQLGGEVNPVEDITLEVYGLSPGLLTGTYRDSYTGKGWQDSGKFGTYRFDSPMWSALRDEAFSLDIPDLEEYPDADELYRSVSVTVVPHRHFGTLFTAGRPTAAFGSTKSFVAYFSEQGELFPKEQLHFLEDYSIRSLQWNPLNSRTVDRILKIEDEVKENDAQAAKDAKKAKDAEDEPADPRLQRIKDQYLPRGDVNVFSDEPRDVGEVVAIPIQLSYAKGLGAKRNISVNYSELAFSIARGTGSGSKFKQAMAIRQYLLDNFKYTLDVYEKTDEDADFVNWFLATGEGYCTYYATAMAVMAREIGIPSRYVEGYLTSGVEQEDNWYKLTGANAHAWAELYFEGIGWIPFDATPIGQAVQSVTTNRTDFIPEIPTPTPEVTYQPGEDWQPEEDAEETGTPLWQIALKILVGLVVLFGLPILIFFLCWRPKLIVARYGRKGAIRAWWREISDVLPHYDNMFQRRGGETATMYARRIGSLVSTPVCTFDQLVRVVIRAYYKAAEPSDVELELVWR